MQKIVIDTIVPAKNKNGKITGKSKLKISSNEDGNLEFEGETENLIDSIPQINKVVKVEVPAEKEKSFWEKLGDNFLSFLNIIFLILGAGAAYLLLALRKHFSNNNKNFD
jgi:hypothetical protein